MSLTSSNAKHVFNFMLPFEIHLELVCDDLGADVFQPIAVSPVLDGGDGEEWPFCRDLLGDDLGEKLVIMKFLLHLLLHLRLPAGIVLESLSKLSDGSFGDAGLEM